MLKLLFMCSIFLSLCQDSENQTIRDQNEDHHYKRSHIPEREPKISHIKLLNNNLPSKLYRKEQNSQTAQYVKPQTINLRLNKHRTAAPVEANIKNVALPNVVIPAFKVSINNNLQQTTPKVSNLTPPVIREEIITTNHSTAERNDTTKADETTINGKNYITTKLDKINHNMLPKDNANHVTEKVQPLERVQDKHTDFYEEFDLEEDYPIKLQKVNDTKGESHIYTGDTQNELDKTKHDESTINITEYKSRNVNKEIDLDHIKSDISHVIGNQSAPIQNKSKYTNVSSVFINFNDNKPSIIKEMAVKIESLKPIVKDEIAAISTVNNKTLKLDNHEAQIDSRKLETDLSNPIVTHNETKVHLESVVLPDNTRKSLQDEIKLGLNDVDHITIDPNETVVIENRKVEEVLERYHPTNDPLDPEKLQSEWWMSQPWSNVPQAKSIHESYQLIPYVYNNIPANEYNSLNMYMPDYAHAKAIENPFEKHNIFKNKKEYFHQNHYNNQYMRCDPAFYPFEKQIYTNSNDHFKNKLAYSNHIYNVASPQNSFGQQGIGERIKDTVWRTWKNTQITIMRNKNSNNKPIQYGIGRLPDAIHSRVITNIPTFNQRTPVIDVNGCYRNQNNPYHLLV